MSETGIYNDKNAFFNLRFLSLSVSTFHDKYYHINPIMMGESIPPEEAEEQEWDRIISNPRVRQGIRRFAAKARQQIAAGETEEGGFSAE